MVYAGKCQFEDEEATPDDGRARDAGRRVEAPLRLWRSAAADPSRGTDSVPGWVGGSTTGGLKKWPLGRQGITAQASGTHEFDGRRRVYSPAHQRGRRNATGGGRADGRGGGRGGGAPSWGGPRSPGFPHERAGRREGGRRPRVAPMRLVMCIVREGVAGRPV